MMLAVGGLTSGLYKTTLIIHLLLVVVGMGSAFVWPALMSRARAAGPPVPGAVGKITYDLSPIFTSLPLTLAGLVGFALIGFSDEAWKFDDLWIQISIVVWLIGVLIGWFVMKPAQKRALDLGAQMAAGGPDQASVAGELEAAGKRVAATGGVLHLITVALVVLMVWKPM